MRKAFLTVSVVAFLALTTVPAFAAIDTTASAAVEAGATDLKDTLVDIATTVLPLAVAVIAIMLGWRLARRFFATR